MEIGINLPVMVPGLDRDTVLDWCRRVDAGPFATLAAGERITFPNPEVMVTLSAAAAVTQRVRIAPTVIVLPMHAELLIAKQIATLDVLSGGRVTLGVGVGARDEDFRAVDASLERKRLGVLERQVERMRRAWAGENLVEGATRPVEPAPLQPGGPKLWAGSLFPQSIRRAARWADGICGFSFGPSIGEVDAAFATARDAWSAAGKPAPRLVTSFFYALGDDARAQLDAFLARYLGFFGAEAAAQIATLVETSSASALVDTCRRLAAIGTDEVILVPTTKDPDEVDRVADLLGGLG